MTDDEDAFERLLIEPFESYARLYPSIGPRLRKAYEDGNPLVKEAVRAMEAAMSRAHGHRERRLRDEFNLTASEVRVVMHLIQGGTVATCAQTLGVAESTVRSHLKSVFSKTGVNRQGQLGRLLAT